MQISSFAAQPQIHRFLLRSSLGVGAAGVVCAGLFSFGGGLVTSAASAAAGGGGYQSGGTRSAEVAPVEAEVAGLAASNPVEVATLDTTAIEPSALQGIVVPSTTSTVAAPPVTVAVATIQATPPAPGTVEATIAEVFGADASAAIGVARCESGLNPGAISRGGGNWGLFQINRVHRQRVADLGYSWEQLLDAKVNSLVAKSIFDEQGWGPWACRHAAR